jgi:parallel beta-helix repeat protein
MTKHYHEIHRYYSCIDPEDGPHDKDTHTNDKAYYPYGRRDYTAKVNLLRISTSLINNWDGNHVKLGIANPWHTFDTDLLGKFECPVYELSPLTDAELKKAYKPLKLLVEPFKYDISDPFDNLFWEDHYRWYDKPEFPTIYGNIKSAVVYNEILTVKVSMLYDNTDAWGSPNQHLKGLWKDRFSAKISTDTGYEIMGNPDELDEHPGEYILKYNVSGIDINSVLYLSVVDNVNVGICDDLIKHITFVSGEVYVPDDYPTIQAAVDAVNAGDTIIVRDGTYTENVNVNKPHLTIQSENGADSTIVQAADQNDSVFGVSADYVTISGFTVKGVDFGIYLGADHCIISDNKVSNNSFGISLHFSSGNTFTSNTVSNNSVGFDLLCSSDNELTGNIVNSNSYGISLQHESSGNELTGNTANSNTHEGIFLYYSSNNNELMGNTALNNEYGIYLEGSSGNTLTDNIANNNYYGIGLNDSSGNTLTDNTANNNGFGIRLESASNNKLTGNTANSNNGFGIFLHNSSANTLTDNTASNGNMWGIFLYYSSNNNKLTSNTASNTEYGITLQDSSGNTLTSNTASNNDQEGICLYSSSGNTLTDNIANSNTEYGIVLQGSSGNTLTSNTANSNNARGIALWNSGGNTLTDNIANSNTEYGIVLQDSSGNTLTDNIANSNTEYGIYLWDSSSNTLKNNRMSENKYNFGVSSGSLHGYLQNIDTSNLVDGKSIYYWVNQQNKQIPGDAGYVGIVNSHN